MQYGHEEVFEHSDPANARAAVQGHGVWLSERAWVIAIVTIKALIAIFVIAVYNYAKTKFT